MSSRFASSVLLSIVAMAAPVFVASVSAATFVRLTSDPGDYIGGGVNRTLTTNDGAFYGSLQDSKVLLTIDTPEGFFDFEFSAPLATAFAAGVYENAAGTGESVRRPILDVSSPGRGCGHITGRFVIFEAARDASGVLGRLAANFEQHCDGGAPALFGIVRFNSDVPADAPEPTPLPPTPTPTSYDVFFLYQSEPGERIGRGVTDFVSDGDARFFLSNAGDRVLINISSDEPWFALFSAPHHQPVVPGTYEQVMSFLDRRDADPAMDVSSLYSACLQQLSGRFVVLEAEYGPLGSVERFAIDFEQRCGNDGAPALRGSIRYHSTVPIETPPPTSTVTSTPTATPTPTNTSLLPLTSTPSLTPSVTLTPTETLAPTETLVPTPTPTAIPCPIEDIGSSVPAFYSYLGRIVPVAPGSCAADKPFGRTYRFTAPRAGRFVFETSDLSGDTALVARAATCAGNELGCNDDAEQRGGLSRVAVSLAAGSEIVLSVGLPTETEYVFLKVSQDDGSICAGDCGGNSRVTVDELILLINAALDPSAAVACDAGIPAGARADISLLVEAVRNTLTGCSG